tara:strand:- start:34541 stop:36145 length:1605 start_codon:yes stop_codon:yes gene_type:complete
MSKDLDLLMLHPGSNKKVYGKLNEMNLPAIETPFTSALTAAHVRDKGYGVEILDANAEGLTFKETAERVIEYNPKLISIIAHGHQPSASSHLMDAIGETCQEIKGRADVPIILSGIHPSSLPERTLREEGCDFVARGEEHSSIIGLLEGSDERKIPGICWIDQDGDFRINKASPLVENLSEEFPDVAWDLLPMEKYRAHNWHASFGDVEDRKHYASLYTSLGCPFKCSFCCINAEFKAAISDNDPKRNLETKTKGLDEAELLESLDQTKPLIRYWDPKIVVDHIEHLANEYGVRHLKFIDEMFVFNKRHVEGIADGIIERGLDLNIWAYARIDTVRDRVLLDKIKKAGINWLILGIESANKDVRYGADKKFGNEDVFKYVKQIEDAGINVMGNFMVGLREDTHESMQQTLDMALELNTPWFNIYGTMAYPGAPDYTWARQQGISLPGDFDVPGGWGAYSHHSWNTLPLPTQTLTAAEVLKFRDDAFHEYFGEGNTSYRNLIRKKLGDKAVAHIQKMSEYRIPRRILEDSRIGDI